MHKRDDHTSQSVFFNVTLTSRRVLKEWDGIRKVGGSAAILTSGGVVVGADYGVSTATSVYAL